MKNCLLYLFSCLVLVSPGDAQVNAKQYSFFHHGAASGLATNEANGSVQDENGYIWIGTTNGLQRFDGTRYLTFQSVKNDTTTIPNNIIHKLYIDRKKNLWVLTHDGKLGIFDTKWMQFREVKARSKRPEALHMARKLEEDEDGRLFLILENEFLTLDEKNYEFSTANNPFKLPNDWVYFDIQQQPGTKKYWIGRRDGLAVFNTETGNLNYEGHNADNDPIITRLGKVRFPGAFLFDTKGRAWFGNWGAGVPGIYAYDVKTNRIILNDYSVYYLVTQYHELRDIIEQKDGTIWIYGLRVLAKYRETENDFQMVLNGYQGEQSINYDIVTNVNEDREQNLWISTNNNGVYRFNPASQFFTNVRQVNRELKKPGEGSNMSFMLDRDKSLLVGTWSDGLFRYDKNYQPLPVNIKGIADGGQYNPYIWCMWPSRDSSKLWMAAQPGIYLVDRDRHTQQFFNPPVMDNRTVRTLAEDKNGNLWMGTQSLGLFKWNAEKGIRNFNDGVTKFEGVPTSQVLRIFIDKEGNVWVGTSDKGLYVIDPDTDKVIMHFGTKEPAERKLLWDGIPAIVQYNDSMLVIAAQGLHLYDVKRKKITRTIDMPESIPANIASMERDRQGYIWMSLSSGIYRVNLRNEIFIHFDRIDGIANDRFVVAASYVLPNGQIIFGADNQFVIFDPREVKINDPSPEVAITDFVLMNKSLTVDSLLNRERIELSPEDNSIVIGFSGLRYNGTYIIRYMLENLDKEWKTADGNNQAVYSYLPPGTYTFLARSEDAEGNPSAKTTRIVIRVKPPFWKTWWFLGLVIFAATVVLFWLDKLRMQRLRATESIRTRIATSLTEDMSNSLSNINISSELAKTKIDTDTDRTKEYIKQISETSNRMVHAMYDMVWSIDPKNDTMANTIERMKVFAAEIENSFPINIDFDLDRQVEKIGLDMEHRYEMLSIFKEAVMNGAKHSNGRYIKVSIRYTNSKMVMMVIDDGKGFSMDDAAMLGRGLTDMRRRSAAINASLYIESEINTGTVVKLEMPVDR